MSMTAAHGISFEVLSPDIDALKVQDLFRAYQAGPDDEFSNWWDFYREIRSGHIVPGVVADRGQVVALFGVELMNRPGPWLNLLFYTGRISRPIMREMVWQLYRMLLFYKQEIGRADEVGAVRILGRPGWRKIAKSMGFEMDRRGFVFDDQKGVKHGYVSRFQ